MTTPATNKTRPPRITSHAAVTPALAQRVVSAHMARLGRKGGKAVHARHPGLLQLNARVAAAKRWAKPGAREAASKAQREAALRKQAGNMVGRIPPGGGGK